MSVVDLSDVKDHLRITDGQNDARLQGMIDAAEARLGSQVGAFSPVTVTDQVVPSGSVIVLPRFPVVSVASVTPVNGSVLDPSSYALDTDRGLLNGTTDWPFVCGAVSVTYTAGWATLPADLVLAVKELVRHLWSSQRGGSRAPGAPADASTPGYLIPNMVASLIEPYRIPGIA